MKNRLPWAVGMLLLGAVALTSGCDDDDNPPPADAGADLGGTGGTGGTPGTDASPDRGMDTPVADVPVGDVPVGGDMAGNPDTQLPAAMKATLGPAGGTVTFHGGRLTLVFPRGALVRPTEIEVSVAASAPAGGLGTVYNIEPAQEALSRPVTVKIRYAVGEIGAARPAELRIGRFAEAHWIDLQNTQVNVAPTAQTVAADLNRLGLVGLIAGVCERCSIECEVNTSCTTMDNAPGKCIAYGTACTKCVPVCDGDGDGFCTNSARPDPNDADINISPEVAEVCGNNYDDNSNNHSDEGCKACAGDAECTIGNEACLGGFCNVCQGACDAATCRFGFMEPSMENPMGSPGVAGRCYNYGTGCSRCVPECDADGDGFCTGPDRPNNQPGGDCNDANRDAYPMAPELCGNGVDDDCNGYVDDKCDPCVNGGQCPRAGFYCSIGACEGCQQACTPGDACKLPVAPGEVAPDGVCKAYGNSCSKCVPRCDVDGDGFCPNVTGNPNIPGGDCDDGEASVYPGAPVEVCGNGEDDNCNDVEDEGCEACSKDDDCPNGNACVGGVCDLCNAGCDVNACRFGVMEGMPGSGVQGKCFEYGAFKACQKCVPACDMDGDGYCPGATVSGQEGGDCLDNNVSAHPGAPEVCGNGLDDDCDGNADEECTSCNTSMMCPALESCSTRL